MLCYRLESRLPKVYPFRNACFPTEGETDADIADRLVVSVSTVRSHLDRIPTRQDIDAELNSPALPLTMTWTTATGSSTP